MPVVAESVLGITGLREKRDFEIGGYVVTPGIMDELHVQTDHWYEHRTGEVYLTDAINVHATHNIFGQVIKGSWYDTGNQPSYLVARFASALAHPEYEPLLRTPGRRSGR